MTEEITASEAARRLGVTDKTLRRWIRQGRIAVREISKTHLALNADDVAALASEVHQGSQGDLWTLYQALEKRVAQLEKEVRAGPVKQVGGSLPRLRPAPLQPALLPDLAETTQGQPEGTITLAQLAASLGVDQSTIKEHLAKGHYEDTPVPHGKLNKHYFTPEQAEQARRYHAEHPPRGQR